MEGWLIWVVAACVFAVAEMLTMGFFLAPFALGAALAAVVDALGASEGAAWAVFVAVSVLSLVVIRPIAMRHIRMPPRIRTGTAALIGRQATVIERIANADESGTVRIGGELWTARSFDDDHVIEPGVRVEVVEIKGATALVTE